MKHAVSKEVRRGFFARVRGRGGGALTQYSGTLARELLRMLGTEKTAKTVDAVLERLRSVEFVPRAVHLVVAAQVEIESKV